MSGELFIQLPEQSYTFHVQGRPDFVTEHEAFAVSFIGIVPPAHGTPWVKVRISEASGWDSPLAEIEEQALSPIDTDPAHPQTRTVTTTLGAWEDGTFALTFIDAQGVEVELPRVQRNASIFYDVRPALSQLEVLLRARLRDENGNQGTEFTEATNPTRAQAQESVDEAVNYFLLDVGYNVPLRMRKIARSLVALCAAATIETAYMPEQVDTAQSGQKTWWAMYMGGLESFRKQIAGHAPNAARPRYGTIQVVGRRYGSRGAHYGSDRCGCDTCDCDLWTRVG